MSLLEAMQWFDQSEILQVNLPLKSRNGEQATGGPANLRSM